MKNLRRITSLLLVAVMVVAMLAVPGVNVQAATKKKVQLNTKTVTLEVGKKVTLKLKNAPKKKKITWSSNNKKIATVSKKGVVTAKKAGKANITAKVNGKKYVCKVTVKNKKVQLNKKTVTLEVGKKVTLKLKNAPKKKKITWSSNNKKIATVSKKGVVTAKKAGKANITAKVNGKKYVCKVTVKNKKKQETPAPEKPTKPDDPKGKNPGDVSALEKIIKEQNSKGAKLPTDLNAKYDDDGDGSFDGVGYQWDENGRLIGICWRDCSMSGSLDLSELTALTILDCSWNQLSSLDVSNNTALTYLDCYINQLSSLDVSNNTALTELNCSSNQLSSLDVSNNTALTYLYCSGNQLSSLDVSNNTALTELYCSSNQLSNLDVSNNTALEVLLCSENKLSSLDVSNNTALTSLDCDDNVQVTGWTEII